MMARSCHLWPWRVTEAAQWAVQGVQEALAARYRLCWRVATARQVSVLRPHDAVSTMMLADDTARGAVPADGARPKGVGVCGMGAAQPSTTMDNRTQQPRPLD